MTIKNLSTLQSDITTLFPDNSNGEITPSDLRAFLDDVADSARLRKIQSASSSSGVVTVDVSLGQHIQMTLTENITDFVISGGVDGDRIIFEFTQVASGGPFTVTWPTSAGKFNFGTDLPIGDFVMSTVASSLNYFGFIYSVRSGFYEGVAVSRGH